MGRELESHEGNDGRNVKSGGLEHEGGGIFGLGVEGLGLKEEHSLFLVTILIFFLFLFGLSFVFLYA